MDYREKIQEEIGKQTVALYERAQDYKEQTVKPAVFYSEISATLVSLAKFVEKETTSH